MFVDYFFCLFKFALNHSGEFFISVTVLFSCRIIWLLFIFLAFYLIFPVITFLNFSMPFLSSLSIFKMIVFEVCKVDLPWGLSKILSNVKQITSPGWMHETSAPGWCTGKTQRDGMGREAVGGIWMGNTCKSMADSCLCMAKATTIL